MNNLLAKKTALGRGPEAYGSLYAFAVLALLEFLSEWFVEGLRSPRREEPETERRAVVPKPARFPAFQSFKIALGLLLIVIVLTNPEEVLLTLLVIIGSGAFIVWTQLQSPMNEAKTGVELAVAHYHITSRTEMAASMLEIEAFARNNAGDLGDYLVPLAARRFRDKHQWPTAAAGD